MKLHRLAFATITASLFSACSNQTGIPANTAAVEKSSVSQSDNVEAGGQFSLEMPDVEEAKAQPDKSHFYLRLVSKADGQVREDKRPYGDRKIGFEKVKPGNYELVMNVFVDGVVLFTGKTDVVIEAGKIAEAELDLKKAGDETGAVVVRVRKAGVSKPIVQGEPSEPKPVTKASVKNSMTLVGKVNCDENVSSFSVDFEKTRSEEFYEELSKLATAAIPAAGCKTVDVSFSVDGAENVKLQKFGFNVIVTSVAKNSPQQRIQGLIEIAGPSGQERTPKFQVANGGAPFRSITFFGGDGLLRPAMRPVENVEVSPESVPAVESRSEHAQTDRLPADPARIKEIK